MIRHVSDAQVEQAEEDEPSMDQVHKDGQADRAVWASDLLMSSQNLFGFSCAGHERDSKAWVADLRRFNGGEPVPDDFLPEVLWAGDRDDDRLERLPNLFQACGFLVVSDTLADILRGFALGASRLLPVKLLHGDRAKPYPGMHLILDLRERKEAFEPEHSRKYTPRFFPEQPFLGSAGVTTQDGDISVSAVALAGADIWHDPQLLKSLFLSDPLMASMKKAKVLSGVRTFRCPVVTIH